MEADVKFILEQRHKVPVPLGGDDTLELEVVIVDAETLLRLRQDVVAAGQRAERDRQELEKMRAELTASVKALESTRVSLHRPGWTAKQKLDEAIEKTDTCALSQ